MTRFFSDGIGRVRGAIAAIFRPATAPVAEVRAATTDDLLDWRASGGRGGTTNGDGVVRRAERCAGVAEHAGAVAPLTGFRRAPSGRPRRVDRGHRGGDPGTRPVEAGLARSASVGVNVLGTGVMLGTFLHTGGLTGAEVGVAAATAFLNQKLLSALFGEAAMVELIQHARRRLQEVLSTAFAAERARFDAHLPPPGELPGLAGDFQRSADEVRALTAVAV